jgi:hypothetical protein
VLIDPHKPFHMAEETAARLVHDQYVDKQTNVVFVDLSIYNYILDFSAWVRAQPPTYTERKGRCNFVSLFTPIQAYFMFILILKLSSYHVHVWGCELIRTS